MEVVEAIEARPGCGASFVGEGVRVSGPPGKTPGKTGGSLEESRASLASWDFFLQQKRTINEDVLGGLWVSGTC